MPVVALKTNLLLNADATPPAMNLVTHEGGRLRSTAATLEVNNNDSVGSVYRFARLPSNARIELINLKCDAITGGVVSFGLYQVPANGGAVALANAYAAGVSIATAITTTEINQAFGTRDIALVQNRLWQDLGLATDSQRSYDLALTLTAATTAAGTITLIVHYVVD